MILVDIQTVKFRRASKSAPRCSPYPAFFLTVSHWSEHLLAFPQGVITHPVLSLGFQISHFSQEPGSLLGSRDVQKQELTDTGNHCFSTYMVSLL